MNPTLVGKVQVVNRRQPNREPMKAHRWRGPREAIASLGSSPIRYDSRTDVINNGPADNGIVGPVWHAIHSTDSEALGDDEPRSAITLVSTAPQLIVQEHQLHRAQLGSGRDRLPMVE